MRRSCRFAATGSPLVMLAVLSLGAVRGDAAPDHVIGYIREIPPESPADRAARHEAVTRRRAGTPIIVHRGAWKTAPENTLEAYAAAMDQGADGCEIDLRRSKDGVIYLHHDDKLGRVLEGSGKVQDRTYHEILKLPMKTFGTATRETRVPTLAAFLVLARQRAMLIHLDVKEPGLQDEIEKMLDQADVWDHIVEVNAGNAEKLRRHPKVELIPYKGWWPEGKLADDPAAIQALLSKPGRMIICEDPRPAVRGLKRAAPLPMPLPEGLRAEWGPDGIVATRPSPATQTAPVRR